MGWADLRTGERRLLAAAAAAEFHAAMDTALAVRAEPAAPRPSAPPVSLALSRPSLALNRPGNTVLRQARAERDSAPVGTLLARLFGLHTRERAWRLGGQGEVRVGRRLERLPPSWHAIHSIPVASGRGDIDHLVVGPGGVFTLNTKHHPGASVWAAGDTFLVNGQRVDYVAKSRREAFHAANALGRRLGRPVPVGGIVVVVGAHRVQVRAQPRSGDVTVLSDRQLVRWLVRRPPVLPALDVASLHALACDPAVWA